MRIFVSSTYEDLSEYRSAVRDAILGLKQQPLMMEHFISEGDPPKKECLKRVKEADVFIGIYAYRYGSIPTGENISITEQEYRYALKKKKKMFCFMVHSDEQKNWPDKYKDDIPQLKSFRGKILIGHFVKFFKTPGELRALVTETLATVQAPESSMFDVKEEAQEEAQKINTKKKLKIIDDLVRENDKNNLTNEAFKSTIKLISSDFRAFSPAITSKFIHYTKNLLKENISLSDFADIANKFTKKVTVQNYIRKIVFASFMFLLLGIFIGFLSYRYNWGGVRVKYLAASNANPIDVVDWLAEEKVGENINFDDITNPGTTRAIVALSFANDLDPSNKRLIASLEKIVRDVSRNTRSTSASFEVLQNNLKILEEINKHVPYKPINDEIDLLKSRVLLGELEKQSQNSTISDVTLLNGYNKLWSDYRKDIDTAFVAKNIRNLQNTIMKFNLLEARVLSDTITVLEKLRICQEFIDSQRPSPEQTFAKNEINKVNNLTVEFASISEEDRFVTCRCVVDLNPQGRSTHFPIGNICAWAQVHAPKNEQVYFKWYANGEHYHTFSVRVDRNLEPGYRVHSAKNYSSEYTGKQEVRLYNSQNQLIGRRIFYVG